MEKTPKNKAESSDLRRQAKALLHGMSDGFPDLADRGVQELIHELQVYQIELEAQNEDLRNVQAELIDSKEKYYLLYNFSPIGYVSMDKKWFIKEANLAFAELIGIKRELLNNLALLPFVASDYHKAFFHHHEKVYETKTRQTCELKLKKKDGSLFWARLVSTAIQDHDDNFDRELTAVIDISERKQNEARQKKMEQALLNTQKLKSIGVLASGIAHGFNNILATILGNVSMARMQVRSEGEVFDLLSEAETATANAQTLTKQLLTFAKGGTPVKEIASIKDFLKQSSSSVLRGSKSKCEFSIAEDLWSSNVDVGQISLVINNVVSNADQAMPEGGIIQIAASNILMEDADGWPVKPFKYLKISIADKGVGIAEKHLSKIFDPYFTTKQLGMGMGLATAYSITKKHDGHIRVDSQPGTGTTVSIYLLATEKVALEKTEIRMITGQGKILFMDDEEALRRMVGRILKNLGYESECAKDGAEATRMVKEAKESGKPYAAVILDLTIPGGMGGKDALSKMLEIDPELKAIVSSGYSNDPVMSNFQEYGFKGIIPKPFNIRSFSKALHEVVKG